MRKIFHNHPVFFTCTLQTVITYPFLILPWLEHSGLDPLPKPIPLTHWITAAVTLLVLWGLTGLTFIFLNKKNNLSVRWRNVVAFLIPIVLVILLSWVYFDVLKNIPQIVSQAQLHRAKLIGSQDELIKTTKGNPLVLRISFKVQFARGLNVSSVDEPRLSVMARAIKTDGWRADLEMSRVSKPTVSPSVPRKGHFQAGQIYEFTTDVSPDFVPYEELLSGKRRICMKWTDEEDRNYVLRDQVPHTLTVSIPALRAVFETQGKYSMRQFYTAALAEGARDCFPPTE